MQIITLHLGSEQKINIVFKVVSCKRFTNKCTRVIIKANHIQILTPLGWFNVQPQNIVKIDNYAGFSKY